MTAEGVRMILKSILIFHGLLTFGNSDTVVIVRDGPQPHPQINPGHPGGFPALFRSFMHPPAHQTPQGAEGNSTTTQRPFIGAPQMPGHPHFPSHVEFVPLGALIFGGGAAAAAG